MRRCIERFDVELVGNMPRGWSVHERAARTLVTLVGEIAFVRTVFRDEFGRRRALTDELLGIPPRARVSPCCFLTKAGNSHCRTILGSCRTCPEIALGTSRNRVGYVPKST